MLKSSLTSQSDESATIFMEERKSRSRDRMSDFRTVLLVEYRDEVFARLAGDFAAMGIWVKRAYSTAEFFRRFASCLPYLTIANADMPNGSGWLLAAKLRLARPTARIWLYESRPNSSEYDYALAEFLGVEELIDYQGNLFMLAEKIRSRVTQPPNNVRLAVPGVA